MAKQCNTMSRKSMFKTTKMNKSKLELEHNLLLALFDVKYSSERLMTGYTGKQSTPDQREQTY
jgi:hypothetical protein